MIKYIFNIIAYIYYNNCTCFNVPYNFHIIKFDSYIAVDALNNRY